MLRTGSVTSLRRRDFHLALLLARPVFGRASSIDIAFETGVERHRIPSAVAMVATANRITYSGAFGASPQPLKAAAIFAIASITKAVTTAAAM